MTAGSDFTDNDLQETQEWLEALDSVFLREGQEKANYLLQCLQQRLAQHGVSVETRESAYVNTIPVAKEAKIPDDAQLANALSSMIRWNAIAMVLRGGKKELELGGHISTYASSCLLYETGFNYFFRAASEQHPGDLVYVQGHASPGIYARAFLEGRISEEQLENFRQEVDGEGVSSYPHPWLMPNFWQFPTVSMGLGPLMGIFQARFLKYLSNRGLVNNQDRKVWVFCGDGEMDEPESMGSISLPVREHLDNLIFVINCNLQRLDGPVRGNGKIIQELEGQFLGAGWHVIKVIWGSEWDELLAMDKTGALKKRMMDCVDGEYQSIWSKDGAHIRQAFFGVNDTLRAMVADMSDEALEALGRGGHDPQKVFAAYQAAVHQKGVPVVILVKTVKGYGMGAEGEMQNTTHQQKKLSVEGRQAFAKRFGLSLSKKQIEDIEFIKPNDKAPEIRYLHEKRQALGGYLPARHSGDNGLPTPGLESFQAQLAGSGDREVSTTMAFVRILSVLFKDKGIKDFVVPIVPDECRTFGMEGLFRQVGIYAPHGQLYEPADKGQLSYYRESKDGQLLQEGLNEAGSFCSWLAAATSYSTNKQPMIPFYIYYSMFGFQRTGDFAWAAGDMRARGFVMGATAGRTTLNGEGLQHADGHNLLLFTVIPNCVCYDPTFAYELAVIIQNGMQRMMRDQEDVYYYITLMNENYHHPEMPEGVEEGIIKGMYLLDRVKPKAKHRVRLLGSGTILREVIAAAALLDKDYGIGADLFSAPSLTECRREAMKIERENRMTGSAKAPYVTDCLAQGEGPVIAATDYIRLYAEQIGPYVPGSYTVLGTDGYGRSDSRPNLRRHFEVDANHIAYTAINALVDEGVLTAKDRVDAAKRYGIDPDKTNPMTA